MGLAPREDDLAGLKPAFSTIEVEEFDSGLTIRIPPAGIWQGSGGLFTFSLIWTGATSIFTALLVTAVLHDPGDFAGGWLALAVFGVFWLVGLATLLSAIHMGRREAAIAIAGDALMVIQKGPFGTKRQEWLLTEVEEVRVGPSGMRVNDVDVVELQIHTANPQKFGMLAGRNAHELHWLADLLTKSLFLQPSTSEEGPAETAT